MRQWCASDCGNKECGFNAVHCTEPEKSRNYVYMKNNIRAHCPGWKPVKAEKAAKKPAKAAAKKTMRKTVKRTGNRRPKKETV